VTAASKEETLMSEMKDKTARVNEPERPSMDEKIDEMYVKKRRVELGGGDERIDRQHDKGKLTARERIHLLLDDDTFVELNAFMEHQGTHYGMENKEAPGEGVVTGYGRINGRRVYLFPQDFIGNTGI
jgi:propionyl-CoA carboxylase beta chain